MISKSGGFANKEAIRDTLDKYDYIGKCITSLRKAKNWSQEDLASKVDTSRVMIGKYERGDNLPSLEAIAKMAKTLDVSVDFLIGEETNASYDKEMIKRPDDIEALPKEEKKRILSI